MANQAVPDVIESDNLQNGDNTTDQNKNKQMVIQLAMEEKKLVQNVDPFDAVADFKPIGPPWKVLDGKQKTKRVLLTLAKIILLLGMLYLFICSLSFLSSAFRLLGGKAAGSVFSNNKIISNPIAGLMIGVVATVLLQSSSTTTSIVVAMVASNILEVSPAIPIVMGANIGTSVTNTIVAIGQIADRDQFRRAFAGATVHDMFNVLCVIVLLPLEIVTGYLYHLTNAIVKSLNLAEGDTSYKKELLKKITKPFTNVIIQLDKKIIEAVAKGDQSASEKSLIKFWCDKGKAVLVAKNITNVNHTTLQNVTVKQHTLKCNFLLHDTGLSDSVVGAIMLVFALFILCVCLILIVKTLHSLLRGQIALVIRKTFNADFPKPFGFLTGYVAILVGAGMTILVQSSSIFTSALTPLVGLGIVSLDRVYPLTLGANIGTTGTGVLAALASSSSRLGLALQIALCHLFFNISGIIIWYSVPCMRRIPIKLARYLGNTTAQYRWFAITYLVMVFFFLPGIIFALSLAGWKAFAGIMIPVALLIIFIIITNILQVKKPTILPSSLRTWKWLPYMCRSLEPYDKVIRKFYKSSYSKPTVANSQNETDTGVC